MYEPVRTDLDILEFIYRKEKGLKTDEEIRAELYKAPYTKKEVDDYMVSEQRKNSEVLKLLKK